MKAHGRRGRTSRRAANAGIVVAVVAVSIVAVARAVASPPRQGLLVAGRSLGGVSLGAPPAAVRERWGGRFGVCRGCPRTTWYFNYRPFRPEGAGVEFQRGRTVAIFTLWSPRGWQSTAGVRLGDPPSRIAVLHGRTVRVDCGRYAALTIRHGAAVTAFYVVAAKVWGFGLSRPGVPVCR